MDGPGKSMDEKERMALKINFTCSAGKHIIPVFFNNEIFLSPNGEIIQHIQQRGQDQHELQYHDP